MSARPLVSSTSGPPYVNEAIGPSSSTTRDRPFNHEAFAATLEFRPAAISFHVGVPRELIAQAHDRGILWLQTVGESKAAEVARDRAYVLIAQDTEVGLFPGFGE